MTYRHDVDGDSFFKFLKKSKHRGNAGSFWLLIFHKRSVCCNGANLRWSDIVWAKYATAWALLIPTFAILGRQYPVPPLSNAPNSSQGMYVVGYSFWDLQRLTRAVVYIEFSTDRIAGYSRHDCFPAAISAFELWGVDCEGLSHFLVSKRIESNFSFR